MDEELLTKARAYFGGDRYAVGSGFVIDAVEGDSATCHFDITDSHLNAAGTVMGGAMFALADYTFAVGCNAAFLRGPAPDRRRIAASSSEDACARLTARWSRQNAAEALLLPGRRPTATACRSGDELYRVRT